MPLTNFPNGISSMGIPLIGGTKITTGSVFFVDSATGSDGNNGKSKDKPFATLDYAIGKCTANKGDIIYVMPNHSETLAAAGQLFDADVAGISIIGLGNGDNMPLFDLNHADAECVVGASNVLIENLNFHANVSDVKIGLDIEAACTYVTVRGCLFTVEATTTDEFLISIQSNAGNSYLTIENNEINMGLGGAVHGVKLTGAHLYPKVVNNIITGDYTTACVGGITTLSQNILIKGNYLIQGIGGNIGAVAAIVMLTGTTGVIADNYIVCNLATKALSIVADQCFYFENYYNEDVTGTGGIIGAASADD